MKIHFHFVRVTLKQRVNTLYIQKYSKIMKFLLGKKVAMSQRYDTNGAVIPVTVISFTPEKVAQVKTKENDGYEAIQVGYGALKHANQPMKGHTKSATGFEFLREFRTEGAEQKYSVGDLIDVKQFKTGDKVDVTGFSKGKGFQGVVKRHGFHGHNETHGTKDSVRMPGAIGSGGIQRVFKGVRMGGRMGHDQVTVKNLTVVEIDEANNTIALKGAVPGARGTLLMIFG